MPAIFFGHGNPMTALEDNACTQAWRRIGAAIPRPRAIRLSVSAHGYLPGSPVTSNDAVSSLVEGMDGGSIAMLAVQLGGSIRAGSRSS